MSFQLEEERCLGLEPPGDSKLHSEREALSTRLLRFRAEACCGRVSACMPMSGFQKVKPPEMSPSCCPASSSRSYLFL